jgi:hypothetical protein
VGLKYKLSNFKSTTPFKFRFFRLVPKSPDTYPNQHGLHKNPGADYLMLGLLNLQIKFMRSNLFRFPKGDARLGAAFSPL